VTRTGASPSRVVGAFLGVLALLLQMGVALAHDPAGLATGAPGLGLPLCHAGGDGAAGPAHGPPAPGKAAVCSLCLGLAAGAGLMPPPAIPGVAIAALPQLALPRPPESAPQLHTRGGPAQPRGPPSLA
jgi:hypothetical protein